VEKWIFESCTYCDFLIESSTLTLGGWGRENEFAQLQEIDTLAFPWCCKAEGTLFLQHAATRRWALQDNEMLQDTCTRIFGTRQMSLTRSKNIFSGLMDLSLHSKNPLAERQRQMNMKTSDAHERRSGLFAAIPQYALSFLPL
jgi:hypothetical protein